MTVVVAFAGPDGAVMASDSEATELDHSKFDMDKIWPCHGWLFGYSGNTAVRDPLAVAIEQAADGAASYSRWQTAQVICGASKPVLAGLYQNHVPPAPAGQVPPELQGALLLLGHDAEGHFVAEINHNNTPTLAQRGFHAIGSGSLAAQVANALLLHYGAGGRTREHLKLIAYRTVQTCVSVLGGPYGVGGDVQLWESTDGDAGYRQIVDDELTRVAHGVEQWTTIERESIDQVAGADPPDGGSIPSMPAEEPEAQA